MRVIVSSLSPGLSGGQNSQLTILTLLLDLGIRQMRGLHINVYMDPDSMQGLPNRTLSDQGYKTLCCVSELRTVKEATISQSGAGRI